MPVCRIQGDGKSKSKNDESKIRRNRDESNPIELNEYYLSIARFSAKKSRAREIC
jgi:hypothetical protein